MEKSDVSQVKKYIENFIGEKVELKSNKGRKKEFIEEGILISTHPCVFVVEIKNSHESKRRETYSYTEVLTGAVKFKACDDDNKHVS